MKATIKEIPAYDWRPSKTWRALSRRDKVRLGQLKDFCEMYDDEPDGAFFAIAEENGFDVDDWAWYSSVMALIETDLKRKKKAKKN